MLYIIDRAFLLIYGFQGLYALLFDANPMGEDLRMMNPQMMMGGAPGQQAKDYSKLFESEKDSYKLLKYTFLLDKSEDYLINEHEKGKLFQ